MRRVIYLDTMATTQVYPAVAKEMQKYMTKEYGNPSSPHALGEKAFEAMTAARKALAAEIGVKAHEIIFTSGGTEANNLALRGIMQSAKKKKLIISAIEHSSVWEVAQEMKKEGFIISLTCVDKYGVLDMKLLEKSIDENTGLVSIIHGNNEIGVLQDIKKIGEICRQKGVLFHTDAVQSFGKIPIRAKEWGVDALSASAHKIGGPKGIGFLYLREGIEIEPLIIGGGQERGMRGGTENLPAIMGFAKALEIAKKADNEKMHNIRNYFITNIEKIGGKINGDKEKRLWNNLNVSFVGINAEGLVIALSQKGVMCSTRSACLSKQHKENRVLMALGMSEKEINGTLRFGLSEDIGKREIDYVIKVLKQLL